jgi:alkyl hydroperoxide reductase subunit AhpC
MKAFGWKALTFIPLDFSPICPVSIRKKDHRVDSLFDELFANLAIFPPQRDACTSSK